MRVIFCFSFIALDIAETKRMLHVITGHAALMYANSYILVDSCTPQDIC